MEYTKGDRVTMQDGGIKRGGTVVKDGLDSKSRVRVRPDGIAMDMSITTIPNDRVYIIE
jgi:hypothetical protein